MFMKLPPPQPPSTSRMTSPIMNDQRISSSFQETTLSKIITKISVQLVIVSITTSTILKLRYIDFNWRERSSKFSEFQHCLLLTSNDLQNDLQNPHFTNCMLSPNFQGYRTGNERVRAFSQPLTHFPALMITMTRWPVIENCCR